MTPDPLTPSPDSPTPRRPWLLSNQYGMEFILSQDNEILVGDKACKTIPLEVRKLIVESVNGYDPAIHKRAESNGQAAVYWKAKCEQLERENAALVKEREEIELIRSRANLVHETNKLLNATLAERDREIERLTKESRDVPLCAHHAEVWFCDRRFQPGDCWFCQQEKELQAATARAEEAELNYEGRKITEEASVAELNKTLTRVLALEAQVGELREALQKIKDRRPFPADCTDVYDWMDQAEKLIDFTLASQPDLPLIEEVRDLPDNTVQLLRDLHAEFYGGAKAHADAFRVLPKVAALLARLNPRKD